MSSRHRLLMSRAKTGLRSRVIGHDDIAQPPPPRSRSARSVPGHRIAHDFGATVMFENRSGRGKPVRDTANELTTVSRRARSVHNHSRARQTKCGGRRSERVAPIYMVIDHRRNRLCADLIRVEIARKMQVHLLPIGTLGITAARRAPPLQSPKQGAKARPRGCRWRLSCDPGSRPSPNHTVGLFLPSPAGVGLKWPSQGSVCHWADSCTDENEILADLGLVMAVGAAMRCRDAAVLAPIS